MSYSASCVNFGFANTIDKAASSAGTVQVFHFPAKSIGQLKLLKQQRGRPDSWLANNPDNQFGAAAGDVSVKLPAGAGLFLEANRRVFENPEVLLQVSPNAITALRLSFIAMDDSEDRMLERAIGYVEKLKGLKVLFVDRCEISDKELSKLKNLPQLLSINCFLTGVRGTCFKNFAGLPELREICLSNCKIDAENYAFLSKISKLRALDLGRTGIDESGAKSLAACSGLTQLQLSGNPKFNDACLKNLAPMSKLRLLDLRDTGVTCHGLCSLRKPPLTELYLPKRLAPNAAKLAAMFPGTYIKFDDAKMGPVSRETKIIYGPLH